MEISYEKLWRLMKKNKLNRNEIAHAAEISEYSMRKMRKSEPVSLEIIVKLCKVFHCNIGDLVDVIED